MPSQVRLDPADVDAVLGVVGEAATGAGSHAFDLPVIERLALLVRADRVGYFEADESGAFVSELALPTLDLNWNEDWVRAVLPAYPLNGALRATRMRAVRMSDVVSRADKLRNAWYMTVMHPCRVEHELKIWLPTTAGPSCGFWFTRDSGSRDFDERAVRVMTVLRPHLAAVYDRWLQRRRRPPGITDREAEVLELLREGLGNREIAERLVLSSHTVRTHLENIFEKLGVHTRTAAVRRAFGGSNGGPSDGA